MNEYSKLIDAYYYARVNLQFYSYLSFLVWLLLQSMIPITLKILLTSNNKYKTLKNTK